MNLRSMYLGAFFTRPSPEFPSQQEKESQSHYQKCDHYVQECGILVHPKFYSPSSKSL